MMIKRNFFEHLEDRHTAVQTSLALAIRVLGAVSAFTFNLAITAKLGAEQSGYFFLAFAVAMILSAFAKLGFDNTILRLSAAVPEENRSIRFILNFSLKYSIPAAFALAVLLSITAPLLAEYVFNKPELAFALQVISPSIMGFSVISLVAMSFQARQNLIASIPCQNIAHLLLCGAAVWAFNVKSADIAALYLSLSLGVTSAAFYWLSIRGLPNKYDAPLISSLWDSAKPNWITDVVTKVGYWMSPVVVGVFLAAEQVAYFSVAQRIALLTTFILMAVNAVVSPKFSAFHSKNDFVAIKRTAIFSVRLLLITGLPIVAIIYSFSDLLMRIFGPEFVAGVQLLKILVVGQVINIATGSVGLILMMCGHERDLRYVTLISGIVAFICIPSFTYFFGAPGAAYATILVSAVNNLLGVYVVKKRLGFNTLLFWQRI